MADELEDCSMTTDLGWLASEFPQLLGISPLALGGQKWVFTCDCPRRGPCVLKLIRPGAGKYLDREIEAVQRIRAIRSGNVPQVYEIGSLDSQMGPLVWLLEQRISGDDLSELISRGPLDKQAILSLALDLTSAARDAESVNVVHRDIKPKNTMVDESGKAWLLDFGIARILDLESKTRTGALVGPHTPGYSAPEQFRYQKRQIDGRSDLFAIGVVLYEAVEGLNPFVQGARDRMEILRRVECVPLPALDLPWDEANEFSGFVSSLTQKFPHQRPKNCAAALNWLHEIVSKLGGS
ncbi:MAG: protein kinase [Candidatus Lokiarchaeota archaeon]|nr:protein kinase [Candidatus Lokiarchaeota archaeon]